MKKIVLNLFVIATFALSVAFTSCNKDRDERASKEISLNMSFTYDYNSVWFDVAGSGTMTIDWGDGTEIETHTLSPLTGNYYFYRYGDQYLHDYDGITSCTITLRGDSITGLNCNYVKNLTALNVNKSATLKALECFDNQLERLDVSGCTALIFLFCNSPQLTSLKVKGCTALTRLLCYETQLTDLDVSGCSELIELRCFDNQLTSLDVNGCTRLYQLNCRYNQLSADALNAIFRALRSIYGYNKGSMEIYQNPGSNGCDKSIAENKGWQVF